MAIVTANFVDRAIAIFERVRSRGDIYGPLIAIILIAGFSGMIGNLYALVLARIKL